MNSLRFDRSNIESHSRSGSEYLVRATIARVGILEYGNVREYNSPEVLRAALDSLRDAPVTNAHPPEQVSVQNFQQYVVGHVVGTPEFRDGMVHATLAIRDPRIVAEIDRGDAREVSAGYSAALDDKPGITPHGEPYDKSRSRITFNHVAIVRVGRAGRSVALQLDAARDAGDALSAREQMLRANYEASRNPLPRKV